MEDAVTISHGTDDGVRALASSLARTVDGVGLAYRVLDDAARRHHLTDAHLVVRAEGLGAQLFRCSRRPIDADTAKYLLTKPAGLYGQPDVVERATGEAFAGMCSLALMAQQARAAAAVDPTTGLASRTGIEGALARSTARAARYSWACTAVLLTTTGTGEPAARWAALCRALHSALRDGDEAGDAGGGRALVIVGAAGPDVVRPLVARVRAALSAAGDDDVDLLAATASAPYETVDPGQLWRLARERLEGSAGSPPEERAPADLSQLELELRAIDGIVAVGLGAADAAGGRLVTVVALADHGDAGSSARRVVDQHLPGATVEVTPVPGQPTHPGAARAGMATWRREQPAVTNGSNGAALSAPALSAPLLTATGRTAVDDGQSARSPRITLVAATFDPASGTSEVRLEHGNAKGTGRAAAGPLAGGAQATLNALGGLGREVPFYLVSAERARTVPGDPVVVVLASRSPLGHPTVGAPAERIGVATGRDDVEAAGRATLSALNRWLAREDAEGRER